MPLVHNYDVARCLSSFAALLGILKVMVIEKYGKGEDSRKERKDICVLIHDLLFLPISTIESRVS